MRLSIVGTILFLGSLLTIHGCAPRAPRVHIPYASLSDHPELLAEISSPLYAPPSVPSIASLAYQGYGTRLGKLAERPPVLSSSRFNLSSPPPIPSISSATLDPAGGIDHGIQSQIRKWELEAGAEISNEFVSRLPTDRDAWISAGHFATTKGMGLSYRRLGQVFNTMEEVYSDAQGLRPMNMALENTKRGSAIYSIAGTLGSGANTFLKTIDRMGTSMQIMNPPIYLDKKHSWGLSGSGSYPIEGGRVHYNETLTTEAPRWWEPGDITRTHMDWATTGTGTYYRHMEVKIPATSPFERFMMHHYPVGSYFDPAQTTMTTTIRSQESYRIQTYGGITKITPLLGTGIGAGVGNWGTFKMPSYTLPKTYDFLLPRTYDPFGKW